MRPTLGTLRATAARRMTETGTITRPGQGGPVFNEDTGQYDNPVPVVVYDGPILVRPQAGIRDAVAGEREWTITRYDVTLPAGTAVRNGDPITVTTAPYDPALVGVRLTVLDVPLDAWQVARTVVAERVA